MVKIHCPIEDEFCPYAEVNEADGNIYCRMLEIDGDHPRDHCDAFYSEDDEDEEDDE